MRILLAGASGLVGGALLRQLADHNVTLIGRRRLESDATKMIGPVAQWSTLISGHQYDVAINCLGTTIKAAGSQAAFAALDLDAVIAIAEAARKAGARQFMSVSSVDASASASNFYLRIKGQAEAGVRALGFDRVDIFRPGLLRGERAGPSRPAERVMIALSPLTDRLTPAAFDKYRSIAADDVASAIAALIGREQPGAFVHHNRDMLREAARIG